MARLLPIFLVVLALSVCYTSAKSLKQERKSEVREVLRELVELLLDEEEATERQSAAIACTDKDENAPADGAFSFGVMNGAMTADCNCVGGLFSMSECTVHA